MTFLPGDKLGVSVEDTLLFLLIEFKNNNRSWLNKITDYETRNKSNKRLALLSGDFNENV